MEQEVGARERGRQIVRKSSGLATEPVAAGDGAKSFAIFMARTAEGSRNATRGFVTVGGASLPPPGGCFEVQSHDCGEGGRAK
jgi:hypothetical protein